MAPVTVNAMTLSSTLRTRRRCQCTCTRTIRSPMSVALLTTLCVKFVAASTGGISDFTMDMVSSTLPLFDETSTEEGIYSSSSTSSSSVANAATYWPTSSLEAIVTPDGRRSPSARRVPPLNGATMHGQNYRGDSANVSRLLDSLLRGYDKRLRPNYSGQQVEVGITMFVSSISHISEVNMDFTMDFYFRQHWTDSRLNFTESGEEELCISNEMLGKIWWPDTFFANARQANFHTATTRNAFLRISPSGMITQSLRLTVTPMCAMDLTYFPMDSQICSLEIESYAYSVKHIVYKWKDGPKTSIGIDEHVQLPQFTVKGYRAIKRVEVLSTGNYSRLACEFYLTRRLGYYVIHIYVPSCLIVVLSWISFWLHRDASPARVALGITTVLTMTTVLSSSNASLPKISYLKSIDIYLVTCFVMVFASLLEFACVSFIGRSRGSSSPGGSSSGGGDAVGTRRQTATSSSSFAEIASRPRWFQVGRSNRKRSNGTLTHEDHLLALCEAEAAFDHTPGCDGPQVVSPTTANGSVQCGPNSTTMESSCTMSQSTATSVTTFSGHHNDSDGCEINCVRDPRTPLHCSPVVGATLAPSAQCFADADTSSALRPQSDSNRSRHRHKNNCCAHQRRHHFNQPHNLRVHQQQQQQQQQQQNGDADTYGVSRRLNKRQAALSRRGAVLACAIDRYSRVVFPVIFIVFNVVYWLVYLHISSRPKHTDFIFFDS